jgi:hypothetical protein
VLLLQHPLLMLILSRGSVLVSPGVWGVLSVFFFPVFHWQLLSQLLPQWVVAVWVCILSSGSGEQLCNPPAILLWSWVFTVLVSWGLVSFLHPFSLGQGQRSVSWFPAVSTLWLLVDCFSIFQCHWTLDVAHCLRKWALWTATCPISGSGLSPTHYQSFCLSSICLLKVHTEVSSLLLPPSPVCFQKLHSSAVC